MPSDKDYIVSIVLPHVQKRFSEAANTILVLEANLLIEQAKIKDLAEQVEAAVKQIEDIKNAKSTVETSLAASQDAVKQLKQTIVENKLPEPGKKTK